LKSRLLFLLPLGLLSGCELFGGVDDEGPDPLQQSIRLQQTTLDRLEEQRDRLLALQRLLEERAESSRVEERLAAIEQRIREASEDETRGDVDRQRLEVQQSGAVNVPGKVVVGSVERVALPELGITAEARMDTGATTSSIHAEDIRAFERDGEDWIRFILPFIEGPDGEQGIEVERPRERRARIIQATVDDPSVRPVVTLRVRIGDLAQRAEFTLADRDNLEFPVLIGRNVLRDLMVVDVSVEHAMGDPRPEAQDREPSASGAEPSP
jgi:hypothetical protein